jgi:hypothetical protein
MSDSITPPPELVEQWCNNPRLTWLERLSLAYAAGADQELEACCEWLYSRCLIGGASELLAARRPKPPSLNEVALQMLGTIERDAHYIPEITDTIRRALEALPE